MNSFDFENKYGKITHFDFYDNEMYIKETWIGDQIIEYRFKYNDVSKYIVRPSSSGYYNLEFWSDSKLIKKEENNKTTYPHFITIPIKNDMSNTSDPYKKIFSDDENGIRKVIYNNTPLRSQLDMEFDKLIDINRLYSETSENSFATICLSGYSIKKDLNNYSIKINGSTFFTVYNEKMENKLKEEGKFIESPAKPYWQDDNTLVFKIPYGNWNIGFSFDSIMYPSVGTRGMNYTEGPKSIDITANEQHKIINLKVKAGLLRNKIIEL